jgi:hypothetical protein
LFFGKGKRGGRGGGETMKRILTVLVVALVMAALMVAMVAPAFARITQTNGGGNDPNGTANGIPRENPAEKCPPGQNTEQQLRKCNR